jgi:DNA repair photolyase
MFRRLPLANPTSRFDATHVEYDAEFTPEQGLELFEDAGTGIVSKNDSPDLPFTASVNPYRGCAHGCAYCYARPSHEYWGFGAGVDFERKLMVKHRAPELLRTTFEKPSWKGDMLVFSGNTDSYQPIERQFELTRRCLQVCLEYRNPVQLITKAALVERDIDVLSELHQRAFAGVAISIPFWDPDVARVMEPYAATPQRRIEVIRKLSAAGIPVFVFVSPLVPGLSDSDVIPILEAAKAAGARSATTTMLRLPGPVKEVFAERVQAFFPDRAGKIMQRIREMRGGELNDSRYFDRQVGQGKYAETVLHVFRTTRARLGYEEFPSPPQGTFQRPPKVGDQVAFKW